MLANIPAPWSSGVVFKVYHARRCHTATILLSASSLFPSAAWAVELWFFQGSWRQRSQSVSPAATAIPVWLNSVGHYLNANDSCSSCIGCFKNRNCARVKTCLWPIPQWVSLKLFKMGMYGGRQSFFLTIAHMIQCVYPLVIKRGNGQSSIYNDGPIWNILKHHL